MLPKFDPFKDAKRIEEHYTRFKVITLVSVDEALTFYLTTGRFPDSSEVAAIRTIGIEHVIKMIQIGEAEKLKEFSTTLTADLDKLQAAKARFWEQCAAHARALRKLMSSGSPPLSQLIKVANELQKLGEFTPPFKTKGASRESIEGQLKEAARHLTEQDELSDLAKKVLTDLKIKLS